MNVFSPLVAASATLRVLLVAGALAVCLLLWRRPRAGGLLALTLGLSLALWLGCMWPQQRLYGLAVGLDRAFAVGMAAAAAAGNSAFDHTQLGLGAPEPFWNLLLAMVSGYEPTRVRAVFAVMPALTMIAVGLGLYLGLRVEAGEEDRWERALTVFAVFALGSFTLTGHHPVGTLWLANLVYKFNHGAAWAVVPVAAGLVARGTKRPLLLGLVLGLLAWMFLVDWPIVLAGLCAGAVLLHRRTPGIVARTSAGLAIGIGLAVPLVLHLLRDYRPGGADPAAAHMWIDKQAIVLSRPYWWTLDLGPLLVLGVLGAWVWATRRQPRDLVLLGILAAAWAAVVATSLTYLAGVAPEPDELHFMLRFATALAAGAALAALARHLETVRSWTPGRGAVVVAAACLPFSFFAYWEAPLMDRYFEYGLSPIPPKTEAYAAWIRENTPADAVFVAGEEPAVYIPALAGRRVLFAPCRLLPRDIKERRKAAHTMLTSLEPAVVQEAAARFGVTHVFVDATLEKEFGGEVLNTVRASGAYRGLYNSTAGWVFAVR